MYARLWRPQRVKMDDPNADTEWNDILRKKGILPPKPKDKEVSEDQIVQLLEDTVKEKMKDGKAMEEMSLDELDELEDEEDERVLMEYRQKRMAEIQALQMKSKFGSVREISAVDYVDEVNKAGEGVWVILHLYKTGIPLCSLVNQHINILAPKFPATKFLKSISTTCIPNYPDKNLPTIFVYNEGNLKGQIVGPFDFGGMNLTVDDLEWMLSKKGAVKTDLEEDPRKKGKPRDVMASLYRQTGSDDDD